MLPRLARNPALNADAWPPFGLNIADSRSP